MISPEGVQVKHGRRFGIVPDYILEARDISLQARAVAAWLAGRSDGFQVRIGPMCRMLGLSEARWLTVRKDLQRIGWWQSYRRQTSSGKIAWCHEFKDTPPAAATIPQKTMDGQTTAGRAMADGKQDKPKGQHQEEKTNKTTTTQNSKSTATAHAVVLSAREAIERHRAQHGLAAWGDQVWEPAASLLGEVDPGLMEPIAAQWRAAMMRTGSAALAKPILYLQKLAQKAKAGEFDPAGYSHESRTRPQPPPPKTDQAGTADFLRELKRDLGRGGAG